MTDEDIRQICIDMAIQSNCGQYYNDEGKLLVCDAKIVEGAKKFEKYIKGTENENI